MKRKKTLAFRISCLALCLCAVAPRFATVVSDAAGSTSEIQALEQQIEQIKRDQAEYEKKLDELKASSDSALQIKSSYEKEIQLIEQKISSTQTLIEQYDGLIAETITAIDGKSAEIDQRFEEFLDRLRISYEDGFANYLVLILNSGSLTDLLMNTERTADILAYDRALMDSLEADKGNLEAGKKELEDNRAAQQKYKQDLENDKAELDAKRSGLNTYIQSLEADAAKYEQLQEEAIKADEELNARLEAALAALNDNEMVQHPVSGGALIWPVSTAYKVISSPFGNRTVNGRPNFHYGVDIPAPAGSNVYASQSGVVVYAEWHYSYGNYVVINHGGGYTTLYAHNTSLAVSAGQTVEQGQVIAYVGQTGSAYGNHCHFEVRFNGAVQNPMNYLTQP